PSMRVPGPARGPRAGTRAPRRWPTRRARTAGGTAQPPRSWSVLLPVQRLQGRPDVPPHPREPRTLERGAGVAPAELVVVHCFEEGLVHAGERAPGAQLDDRGGLGEALVPGADVVADVAPEGVALHLPRERVGNRTPL